MRIIKRLKKYPNINFFCIVIYIIFFTFFDNIHIFSMKIVKCLNIFIFNNKYKKINI